MTDVLVIGGGIAGMATATRLQAQGLSTVVIEAHGQPGGCAGFFRRRGFSFDVGATTLVDFEPGGVGGQWLSSIGMPPLEGERLPAYMAWLPNRSLTLYRGRDLWQTERLRVLGDTPNHRAFWLFMDRLAAVFWKASRNGIKLPLQSPTDAIRALSAMGPVNLPLARYQRWTMKDALRAHHLLEDRELTGFLSMLIEDTVHSSLENAPLVNAALGITIRDAGLTRPTGGMGGFWKRLQAHYKAQGGVLETAQFVEAVTGRASDFTVRTRRGEFHAAQVVSAVPIALTARMAPPAVAEALRPFIARDAGSMGGAIVVSLGVPDEQVEGQAYTHHQILNDAEAPLGDGNNMFISVSARDDVQSAPLGHRAVLLSTHCDLDHWQGLSTIEYEERKQAIGDRLLSSARRVYPNLGNPAGVYEVATPSTYERFTHRPHGAVGGVRQTVFNANQRAVPHDIGIPGFHLAGDTTWPGLGTVACVLGSRIVAEHVIRQARPNNREHRRAVWTGFMPFRRAKVAGSAGAP